MKTLYAIFTAMAVTIFLWPISGVIDKFVRNFAHGSVSLAITVLWKLLTLFLLKQLFDGDRFQKYLPKP